MTAEYSGDVKSQGICRHGIDQVVKEYSERHIEGLAQDCSISSALAMDLQQSCTKPSIWEGLST